MLTATLARHKQFVGGSAQRPFDASQAWGHRRPVGSTAGLRDRGYVIRGQDFAIRDFPDDSTELATLMWSFA
jgi:hypothetical protein